MFAYLWVMFLLFQMHQYVVLAKQHIPFTQFGVGLANALVLARRSCWWPTTFGSASGGGDGP